NCRAGGPASVKLGLGRPADYVHLRFLSRSTREVFVRPGEPAADFLEVCQRLVGGGHNRVGRSIVAQQQDRAGLSVPAHSGAKHDAVSNSRLPAQSLLQVLRINLEAGGRDYDILTAAFEIEIAFLVHGAKISGAKPALVTGYRLSLLALPVLASDIGAAHQDFPCLRIKFHFPAGKNFADRSPPDLE